VIVWMQKQISDQAVPISGVAIFPGCCSYLNPPEEFLKLESGPFLACWYHLASLEVMVKTECGILEELRKRTDTQRILLGELLLNHHLMAKHISSLDTDDFFLYLPEYIVKAVHMKGHGKSGQPENICDLTTEDFPSLQPNDWKSKVHLWVATDALLALMARAMFSKVHDFQESLSSHVASDKHLNGALGSLVECSEKRFRPKGDTPEVAAHYLGGMIRKKLSLTPDEMFIVSFRLWQWLRSSEFRIYFEDEVADHLSACWENIIENQRSILLQPMITVPAIEGALKGSTKGIKKIAGIVLAAENAVGCTLNADLREDMKK